VPFPPLDPGSRISKKSGSGFGMNNPDHNSESLKTFFGYETLNYLLRIRDGKNSDPEWEKFGSGIKDGKNSVPV
jgi:hypothetical protein